MSEAAGPKVLCVDDEPNVLRALGRYLHGHYRMASAGDGEEGLRVLREEGPFAVVVSDYKMPRMNGVDFLRRVREDAPDTVRILLTGQADLGAAMGAVNEGNVFRFLSKPCPPEILGAALAAGVQQYRLVTAERILLERTLRGSVQALVDVLALAHPLAFGRAQRLKRYASSLAAEAGLEDRWPVEVAAMLSQLGAITLPEPTLEKIYRGEKLDAAEARMAERIPETSMRLLEHIPRLEMVRDLLMVPPVEQLDPEAPLQLRLYRLVLDYDALESRGMPAQTALAMLEETAPLYGEELLEAFERSGCTDLARQRIESLSLRGLKEGMVFADDLLTQQGGVLVARGQQVTEGLLERIRNFSERMPVKEPVRMIVRALEPEPIEAA